jgi:hypothetical protein
MKEIVLSEASIKIIDAQQLTENSVVVVTVDIGNLPAAKATHYMEAVRSAVQTPFAPAQVIISPRNVDIQIFSKENL